MPQPVARQGDPVTGVDVHLVLVPSPGGPVPTPVPLPFSGTIVSGTVADVLVGGMPVAVVGSTAQNVPPHVPPPPATGFANPPRNDGTVTAGSPTVLAGGKPVARIGDQVLTCFDVPGAPSTITGGAPDVLAG